MTEKQEASLFPKKLLRMSTFYITPLFIMFMVSRPVVIESVANSRMGGILYGIGNVIGVVCSYLMVMGIMLLLKPRDYREGVALLLKALAGLALAIYLVTHYHFGL